ncbi:MAG: hypothetical protein IJZ89_03270 [Clostridia bacterium]|nr:hypothetical protein [Clostridia bacterium]
MEISMMSLARMTLLAFALGLCLGALYDVFRITRVMFGVSYGGKSADHLYSREYPLIGKLKRKKSLVHRRFLDIIIAVGDVFFCLIAGSAFSVFIYYTNDGIFRFQAFAAAVFGFFVYYKTLVSIIIFFAEIICICLKIITKIFLYTIAFPFKIMYNIFITLVRKVFGIPFRWISFRLRLILTDRRMKALMADASSGFLKKYLKG